MEKINFRYYEFGDFKLDARRRILLKSGESVHLSGRIFDLLLVMVQNEGRILEHEELLDKVWEGLFVEQSNLKKGISALRHILEESPSQSLFIKTVPRRGYSFVASVRALPDDADAVFLRESSAEIIIEEEIIEETADIEPKILLATKNESFSAQIRRNKFKIAVVGAFLITTALAIFAFAAFFSKANSFNFSVENVVVTRLTATGNVVGGSAVISPDGKYVVFATMEKDGEGLWIKQISTQSATQLIPNVDAQIWSYAFAPDNEFIYYVIHYNTETAKSGLYKTPLFGGTPVRVFEKANGTITISPNSKKLVFFRTLEDRQSEIILANTDGSDEKRLAIYDEKYRIWDIKFSPDGTSLLCTIRREIADKTVTFLVEIYPDGRKEQIILPEQSEKFIVSATWLPDKNSILLSARLPNSDTRQIWQFFPAGGTFKRVTNDDNSYKFLSVSQDGKSLVTTEEKRAVSIWTTENLQDSLLFDFHQTSGEMSAFDRLNWTNDDHLVFSVNENGNEVIGIMSADGTNKNTLTEGKDGIWLYPNVSQDGKYIIFGSNRTGRKQIWRMDLDGKNQIQLTDAEATVSEAKLLSDGQTLIYQATVAPFGWVLFMKKSDGSTKRLTETEVDTWDISPDEKLLAYVAHDAQTKQPKTFIRPLEGGDPIKVFDFVPIRTLRWTRDGKALTFDVRNGDSGGIVLQPLDGEKRTLTTFNSDRVFWFDWSFDGKKFACIRGKQLTNIVMIKAEENARK